MMVAMGPLALAGSKLNFRKKKGIRRPVSKDEITAPMTAAASTIAMGRLPYKKVPVKPMRSEEHTSEL